MPPEKVVEVFHYFTDDVPGLKEDLANISKGQKRVFRRESRISGSILQAEKSETAPGWDIFLEVFEEGWLITQNLYWIFFFKAFPTFDLIISSKTTIAKMACMVTKLFTAANKEEIDAGKKKIINMAEDSLNVAELDKEAAGDIRVQISLVQEAHKAVLDGEEEMFEKIKQQMLKNAEGWL